MSGDQPSILRRSAARYFLVCLVMLAIIGIGTTMVSRMLAVDSTLDDARARARSMTHLVVAPLVNLELRSGDQAARARLGRVLEDRLDDGSVIHVWIYDPQGQVLWSDDASYISQRVELAPDVQQLFGTSLDLTAEPGKLEPHPWSEPADADLIQSYVGARDADGQPFVLEADLSPADIDEQSARFTRALLPVALGAMLLFVLATFPLSLSLAKRVDRAASQRSALLSRSLAAWHEERRRMAQVLHDGVIQDLSAASYALPMVIDRLPAADTADLAARDAADRIGGLLEEDLRELRSIVHDLFPDELSGTGGLAAALETLRSRTAGRNGLNVLLAVDPDIDVPTSSAGLAYRVVREGLNNIARHAHAGAARVVVSQADDAVVVTVADDGVGLSAGDGGGEGHMGLRLLEAQLADVGGRLDLRDGPDRGAVLTAWVPAELPR